MTSEASSSFPTSFTCLIHDSTTLALAHPQVGVSTVRWSSVAFLSFHFPRSHLHFLLFACLLRLLVARPHVSPTSSHITITPGHLRRHSYQHQRQFHRSPLSRLLSVGFQPSRVTGPQATSPSPPHLTIALLSYSTPGCFRFFPGESLSLAPTRARPPTVRPNDATTASLLAPSEDSFSFPTGFTRLTSASTIPALAQPP